MSHSPLVTTFITTYRRPQLLKRALDSILAQTYPHFQVIVYDNASGDETEEIVRNYMTKDSRVMYHCHQENIGMMNNYAYAFSKINTPYFSFLSDDDYLLPSFYETALQGFQIHPDIAYVACDAIVVNEKGEYKFHGLANWQKKGYYPVPDGLIALLSSYGKFFVPAATLFQTSLVKDIKPNLSDALQPRWDSEYILRITSKFPILIESKPGAVYVAHPHSFSTAIFTLTFPETIKRYTQSAEHLINHIYTLENASNELKFIAKQHIIEGTQKELKDRFDILFREKKFHDLIRFFQYIDSKDNPYRFSFFEKTNPDSFFENENQSFFN